MDRLQEQARRAREDAGAGKSQPVARGELMSRMDSCWLKSPLLRPQTAPARVSQAAAAERRKAEIMKNGGMVGMKHTARAMASR